MKRSVRQVGWFLAVVGALVAFLGFAGGLMPLMAIGPVLACAGVWNICRPSVNGLIVDGGAMILTGAFNGLAWLWLS